MLQTTKPEDNMARQCSRGNGALESRLLHWLFLIAVLAYCAALRGDDLPAAPPSHILTRGFVLAHVAMTAASIADTETTVRGIQRGCVETSPWYPKRPTRARLYAQDAAFQAAVFGFDYWMARKLRHVHTGEQHATKIMPLMWAAARGLAAWSNAGCRG